MLEQASAELTWLKALPERIEDHDLERVKAIAYRTVPQMPSCTDDQFAKYIRIMQTELKSRPEDEQSGKILLRVYHSRLGHHPAEAIQYLAQRCVDTMIFFPTVKECHDVLEGWVNPMAKPSDIAMRIVYRQAEHRLEDFRATLRNGTATQPEVDALPERWRAILMEQGFLRFDGEYTQPYLIRERKAA